MPLFEMPRPKKREFKFSSDMQTILDRKIMDESQLRKFSEFPELLEEELENLFPSARLLRLENELAHPNVDTLRNDIMDAVYTNNPQKFFYCVAKVGVRSNLRDAIYGWLVGKEDFNVKRDLPLLKRLERSASIFNIFDY